MFHIEEKELKETKETIPESIVNRMSDMMEDYSNISNSSRGIDLSTLNFDSSHFGSPEENILCVPQGQYSGLNRPSSPIDEMIEAVHDEVKTAILKLDSMQRALFLKEKENYELKRTVFRLKKQAEDTKMANCVGSCKSCTLI